MQEHESKLTVIVPITKRGADVFNLVSWLSAIDGYLISVIIVHDIQDDITGKVLAETLQNLNNEKIQLVEGKFGSPGAARNFGMMHCDTEWICFWDSDDLPQVDNFLNMVLLASNSDYEIAVGSFEVFAIDSPTTKTVWKLNTWSHITLTQIALNPGIWRFAFRTSLLEEKEFIHSKMGEDQAFIALLDLPRRKCFFSSTIVYKYETGGDQRLTSQKDKILELEISRRYLSKKCKVSTFFGNVMRSIIYFRQTFTLAKVVNRSQKKILVSESTIFLGQNPFSGTLAIFILIIVFFGRRRIKIEE